MSLLFAYDKNRRSLDVAQMISQSDICSPFFVQKVSEKKNNMSFPGSIQSQCHMTDFILLRNSRQVLFKRNPYKICNYLQMLADTNLQYL